MKTKPSIPERRTIPVSCNKDCGAGCPLLAHVEDGKIIKITDNPKGTPYMKGCSKGDARTFIESAGPDRGLEAYRILNRNFDPHVSGKAYALK